MADEEIIRKKQEKVEANGNDARYKHALVYENISEGEYRQS